MSILIISIKARSGRVKIWARSQVQYLMVKAWARTQGKKYMQFPIISTL